MQLRTLTAAERYLENFINRERRAHFDYERLGLGRIRALLDALHHPEAGLPCIHIAGSKGKGTVALTAEALMRAAGRRVGTYTSPHLESWLERFRIDGRPVGEPALCRALSRIQPHADRLRRDSERCPSFFDVSTALALEIFREHDVDVGVIEVGIGGRLDSTNVVESRVSVITTIQLEHMDKLGDTLEAIAREKAGILRPGVPVVHAVLDPEAQAALMARSAAEDSPLEEVPVSEVELDDKGQTFRLADGRRIRTRALGAHQATNVAVGLRAVEEFLGRPLSASAIRTLEDLTFPARIEVFGDVILDSAHTPDSAAALRSTLEQVWPGRGWVLALSISRDKDARQILEELAPPTRACILSRAPSGRAHDPEVLEAIARGLGISTVESREAPVAAMERALALRRPEELVVLTGSIYFAGALRGQLLRGD